LPWSALAESIKDLVSAFERSAGTMPHRFHDLGAQRSCGRAENGSGKR